MPGVAGWDCSGLQQCLVQVYGMNTIEHMLGGGQRTQTSDLWEVGVRQTEEAILLGALLAQEQLLGRSTQVPWKTVIQFGLVSLQAR